MIKDNAYLKNFENELISKQKLPYEKALKIFEAMWEEGVSLGVLPPKDPLEGIEVDIRVAKILNSCSKS